MKSRWQRGMARNNGPPPGLFIMPDRKLEHFSWKPLELGGLRARYVLVAEALVGKGSNRHLSVRLFSRNSESHH